MDPALQRSARTATADPSPSASVPSEATSEQRGSHVLQRGIVFDNLRILYVPVPKAGCTALLWSLAGLAGLEESTFAHSAGREVSRALTIHDLSRWPESFRFGERSPEDRERLLAADDWLCLTVARHPFRRLWSAWQSKVLLAEPQFIEKYSSQPWFPGPVRSAPDVLKSFREFLDALEHDPDLVHSDVHWAPQIDVIEHPQVSYDHLGRVEKLDETLDRIREHLRDNEKAVLPDLPRTNVSTLPYADELFTESDIRFLAEIYADDMRVFGYPPPNGEALRDTVPGSWMEAVDATVSALKELRHRNERVGDLHHLLNAKQKDLRAMTRRKQREEKLRREEHGRNQRLQERLRKAMVQLQHMRNSRTWRYTAPLRKAGVGVRRARRAWRGDR